MIIHLVENNKKAAKLNFLDKINNSNEVKGFVGWVGGGMEPMLAD